MLNVGDIVKLNYNQSLILGKIAAIGKYMHYILIEDIVFMVPVKSEGGRVEFALQKTKESIHFVGGGFFATVLKMDDDLFKKYTHTTSGLILVPGSKGIQ
jgi:hypothetical protein